MRHSSGRCSSIPRSSLLRAGERSTELPGIGSLGLVITEVGQEPDGDVTFPAIDPEEWLETGRESYDGYSFVSYRRRSHTESAS